MREIMANGAIRLIACNGTEGYRGECLLLRLKG